MRNCRLFFAGCLLGLPLTASAEGECESYFTASQLLGVLDDAETAYSDLEVEAFGEHTAKMRAMVPCMGEEVGRPVAARVHRFDGLTSFVAGDLEAAARAFAAARTIEPRYTFPSNLVPTGNPILDEYNRIDVNAGAHEAFRPPKVGRVQLDGKMTLERPTDWPTVAQVFGESGEVLDAAYLRTGDPWLTYEELPEGQQINPLYTGGDTQKANPKVPMFAGAGVSAVAAGVFYGMAAGSRSRWSDPTTPVTELEGLRSQTNTMGAVGIAAGGLAVGLGVTGVFVAQW